MRTNPDEFAKWIEDTFERTDLGGHVEYRFRPGCGSLSDKLPLARAMLREGRSVSKVASELGMHPLELLVVLGD